MIVIEKSVNEEAFRPYIACIIDEHRAEEICARATDRHKRQMKFAAESVKPTLFRVATYERVEAEKLPENQDSPFGDGSISPESKTRGQICPR